MKITVLDGYALNPGDLSWDGFKQLGELTVYPRTSRNEVIERASGSEILLTNKTVLDGEIIRQLPKLKYIGVLATGFNVVDIKVAKERGVVVTNIPAYSTMSVAQKVFALLLAVTDSVEHYALENRHGKWSASADFCWMDTPLMELAGRTMGIVGFGNIGSAVAKIALSFGMKVLAATSKDVADLPDGVEKTDINGVFVNSDVVSLHCPLTESNYHLVDKRRLESMKPGAILINTGRGPLVDEEAVAESLKSGKLGAFCADVLSTEPPAADNPLLSAPRSFITPHIAWATLEARERLMELAVDNLKAWLANKPVNVVN